MQVVEGAEVGLWASIRDQTDPPTLAKPTPCREAEPQDSRGASGWVSFSQGPAAVGLTAGGVTIAVHW